MTIFRHENGWINLDRVSEVMVMKVDGKECDPKQVRCLFGADDATTLKGEDAARLWSFLDALDKARSSEHFERQSRS